MDYVDWVGKVLAQIVEASRTSLQVRNHGVMVDNMARELHGQGVRDVQTIRLRRLFAEMADAGFLEKTNSNNVYKLSAAGRSLLKDPTSHWETICGEELEPDQKELLLLVNRLSPRVSDDGVSLEWVDGAEVLPALDWPDKDKRFWTVAREIDERGLAREHGGFGSIRLKATYRGLVWETRRGFTLESKFIDGLVAEWETTSVDFKRELHLDTADQKAEFVKDVLGLANTQASGRRWMVIGFDNKTRSYHGPPDQGLTQNRIEQILSQYTAPNVDVRYTVVDYRAGKIGKLEVLRDAKKLPYQVAKSIGDKAAGGKKRIEDGQVFVRHGSQTEPPTPAELQALEEEGERARTAPSGG